MNKTYHNILINKKGSFLGTYTSKSKWLERSGVDQINLYVGRKPRFYAWVVFDQGDYTCKPKC
ncbi:MAG: hypothetical protein ACLVE2_04935 [Bacteroides caccae]